MQRLVELGAQSIRSILPPRILLVPQLTICVSVLLLFAQRPCHVCRCVAYAIRVRYNCSAAFLRTGAGVAATASGIRKETL